MVHRGGRPPGRSSAAAVAVVVALAVAGAAAVPVVLGPTPAGALPTGPARPVDVYGDSVVGTGARQIAAALRARGWDPRVRAIPGVSIEQVASAVTGASSVTDVVVLGLGYSYFWKPVVLRRQIDAVMYALSTRGVRRVIWLNVRENRPERRDVNTALTAATRRWGNLEVADWNRLSVRRSGVFEQDGHHLAPEGGRLMGSLMADRLDAYAAGAARGAPPSYGARMASEPHVRAHGAGGTRAATAAAAWVRRAPLVGVASTPTGRGYWLARRNGAVRAFGDARGHGDAADLPLREPVVGIAATPTGRGYWLVAADGGVFTFGDARFHGSTGAIRLRQPIVGIAAHPGGRGYWLVAADGGVFSFGAARFYGSTGALPLEQPIVGIAAHPRGRGYWLVAYDGGVFTFGASRFFGSGATVPRYWMIAGIAATPRGGGYWLVAANGEVLAYGGAAEPAWEPSITRIAVAVATRPTGGYWLASQGAPSV